MAPTTSAAMGSVPVDKAGVGSAVINACARSAARSASRSWAPLVAASVSVGQRSPAYAGQFVDGYHRALLVGAAILLAGAVLAVPTIRPVRRPEPLAVAAEEALDGIPVFEQAA